MILTLQEAAAKLRVSPWTVRALMARGELPYLRIGRGIRFLGVSVDAWVRARNRAVKAGRRK